jgi:hypothetical protein
VPLVRPRSLRALVFLSLLGACAKRPAAPPDAVSSAAASASVPAPSVGKLGTPTAFELAASPTGATLVWAPENRANGALRRVELDASGRFQGEAVQGLESAALSGEVADLAAAWVGSRLALAWVERRADKARVRAAWSGTTAPPFELGAAWRAPQMARGNLVVAARDDRALVFARGDEAACIEPGRHGCFAFEFHELGPDGAKKTGLPMSVPVPCADDSAQLAVVGARFHYGVCTNTGDRPVTTMFTIERNPDYARADPMLEGCTPAGTFVWQGAAWLVAECEGGRRAARLGARDEPAEFLDLHGARLECKNGGASIRAASLDLALDEPRSGLAALLPKELAPPGARSVWTGRALVVGTTLGAGVRLVRYTCAGEKLEREVLAVQ